MKQKIKIGIISMLIGFAMGVSCCMGQQEPAPQTGIALLDNGDVFSYREAQKGDSTVIWLKWEYKGTGLKVEWDGLLFPIDSGLMRMIVNRNNQPFIFENFDDKETAQRTFSLWLEEAVLGANPDKKN